MGGPQTLPHYPMGWAMVSGTPFRLYKINTHQGGHQVPCIISKGDGLPDGGGLRTQYQHVTDLLPTVLDLVGVDLPTTKHGQPIPAPAGTSFTSTLADAEAASTHTEQYYEQAGHRGFYRDGWSAVTCHGRRAPFSEDTWELHHLAEDPTESRDLAAEHPDKVTELQEAWEQAAWANQVYPLDEGSGVTYILRPPWEEVLAEPATFLPGTPTVERFRSVQFINFRSFTVDVILDHAIGDQGVLVAHGDQGGGYSLYVEDGHIFLAFNGYGVMTVLDGGTLAAGASSVTLEVEAPGEMVLNATLRVEGDVVGEARDLPALTSMAPFEGIDVGIDRRAVMESDILTDGEGIDRPVLVNFPGFGDRRLERRRFGIGVAQIEHHQAFEYRVDGVGCQPAAGDMRIENAHLARHAPDEGAAFGLYFCRRAAGESERARDRDGTQQSLEF